MGRRTHRRPCSDTTARTTFTVGRVPAAGLNSDAWVRAALILVVGGALLVFVAGTRRRRRADA
jgi:hypothetical protein